MQDSAPRTRYLRVRTILLIGAAAAALTALFRLAEQALLPGISPWESNALLVGFVGCVAGIAGCYVLRRFDVLGLRAVAEESQARERSVLDATVDGIITIDETGRIESVNPAAVRMFGYPADELVGSNLNRLMPSPYRDEHDQYLRSYLATGVAKIIGIGREVVAQRKDGSNFPIDLTVSEARLGRRRLFTGIVRDITDRKRVEERAAQLGAILEESLNEIYIFDGQSLRFIHVNRGARENLGYSLDELRNLTPLELEPEFTRESYEAMLAPLRSGEMPSANFQTSQRRKDGSLYRVDVHLQQPASTNPDVFMAVILDITEREELQAQLVQAQKMEAIGQLAGGIAHDFNNLLTSIQGSSELLGARLDAQDRSQRAVRRIQQAAERGASLTQHLLAFSRRQVPQPRVLDLNTCVTETSDIVRRLIREDVEVSLELDPAPDAVQADPTQIDQILMNLIVNAGDAMPQGGRLCVRTANRELDGTDAARLDMQPGAVVCLEVCDTGVGMDEATLGRIFEPFFTTKEVGKGTGLGLATVYGIVKQAGWGIEVDSSPGKGSSFRVYIPRCEGAKRSVDRAREVEAISSAGQTILLVEDDELVRDLAVDLLESTGHRVLAASGVQRALGLAAEHGDEIALVISDVVMLQMTGLELTDRLRRDNPELKVLLMSGHTDSALAERGVLPAELPFIKKPFSNASLLNKVQEVLGSPGRPTP